MGKWGLCEWGNGAMKRFLIVPLPHLLFCLIASLTFFALACRSASTPEGPLQIALAADSGSAAVVRVSGLSSRELERLRASPRGEDGWHALLRVTVAGETVPVVGRYVATDRSLEFQPGFPFDPGRSYSVRFDPARLPDPRAAAVLETVVSLPTTDAKPSTVVAAVYPSGDVWPENLLRFYIHFSAPMSRQAAVGLVRLVDDAGREVRDALLELDVDLWNDDRTRYTVFFDPGRVKRGVRPNVELGRALEKGRRYAITVDPSWRDGRGQPLAAAYRREFLAGPAVERPLAPGDWQLQPAAAGTRNPLVVTFPWPLDHGLLQRAVGVTRVDGTAVGGEIKVDAAERRWSFLPTEAWRSGGYQLVVLTLLEDPAGNKVGRAFEIEPSQRASRIADPEQVAIAFSVK